MILRDKKLPCFVCFPIYLCRLVCRVALSLRCIFFAQNNSLIFQIKDNHRRRQGKLNLLQKDTSARACPFLILVL
ncbi:transposase [Treponema sp. Marseille-Q3903]|uniref:transposase n=1 Tax=Treponema sp. Marseille-Q3903 TaxID=2766703 RepID=UPI00351C16F4